MSPARRATRSIPRLCSLLAWCAIGLPRCGGADGDCIGNDSDGDSCIAAQSSANANPPRRWKWDPAASHPCNIRRISRSELLRSFGGEGVPNLYPYPLVIYPDGDVGGRRATFANLTALDHLPTNFPPDFRVTLTGSDSLSSHRRTIPLKQYLHEVLTANDGRGETLPDRLGNETWYLFGETFSAEWSDFLQQYDLPPCQSCTPLHREQNKIAISFGIGNVGSGVQWHLHGPGFSETIHGRKHWVLYPPGRRPDYDLDYASRHWMENAYPKLKDWTDEDVQQERKRHDDFLQHWKNGRASVDASKRREAEERGTSNKKPWECTVREREMIYFPDQWHHATVNLERYTVFVSSFTTEHEG